MAVRFQVFAAVCSHERYLAHGCRRGGDREADEEPLKTLIRKRPRASPAPEQPRLLSILVAQPGDSFNKNAHDHRAIIVGKLDQARLHDEPPELDEVTRTLAALHDPGPAVVPRPTSFVPPQCCVRSPERCSRRENCGEQHRATLVERSPRPLRASPPWSQHPL